MTDGGIERRFPFAAPQRRMPRKSGEAALDAAPHRPALPGERILWRDVRPDLRAVISVTGSSSNAGKTWIVEKILGRLKAAGVMTAALKLTRTHIGAACPRANDSCGTCDSLDRPFELITDRARLDVRGKDTGRYFAAGADQVIWLLVRPDAVSVGVKAALADIRPGFVVVAEGNSFRDYVDADLTWLAITDAFEIKKSAQTIFEHVDIGIARDPQLIDRNMFKDGHGRYIPIHAAADVGRLTDAWCTEKSLDQNF